MSGESNNIFSMLNEELFPGASGAFPSDTHMLGDIGYNTRTSTRATTERGVTATVQSYDSEEEDEEEEKPVRRKGTEAPKTRGKKAAPPPVHKSDDEEEVDDEESREKYRLSEQNRRGKISALVTDLEKLLIAEDAMDTPFFKMLDTISVEQPAPPSKSSKKRKAKMNRIEILQAAKQQLQMFNKAIRFYKEPTELNQLNISSYLSKNMPCWGAKDSDLCYDKDIVVIYGSLPPLQGFHNIKMMWSFASAFSGHQFLVSKIDTSGSLENGVAYMHYSMQGNLTGELFGIPGDGKPAFQEGLIMWQIKRGKIVYLKMYDTTLSENLQRLSDVFMAKKPVSSIPPKTTTTIPAQAPIPDQVPAAPATTTTTTTATTTATTAQNQVPHPAPASAPTVPVQSPPTPVSPPAASVIQSTPAAPTPAVVPITTSTAILTPSPTTPASVPIGTTTSTPSPGIPAPSVIQTEFQQMYYPYPTQGFSAPQNTMSPNYSTPFLPQQHFFSQQVQVPQQPVSIGNFNQHTTQQSPLFHQSQQQIPQITLQQLQQLQQIQQLQQLQQLQQMQQLQQLQQMQQPYQWFAQPIQLGAPLTHPTTTTMPQPQHSSPFECSLLNMNKM